MTQTAKKVALITGANKGIGFELCKQLGRKDLRVVLTARDPNKGEAAAKRLQAEGLDVVFHQLDVTEPSSIERAYDWLIKREGRLDYLVNNAGILADSAKSSPDGQGASIFKAKIDTLRESMEVNTYGAIRMAQKFVPLMLKNNFGRIINVSSGMGQLSEMNGGYPAYRISKTSLNAVTRILADELSNSPVTVVSICPGWVKTDMGGPNAELDVSDAVTSIVQTLLEDTRTGVFLRHGEILNW